MKNSGHLQSISMKKRNYDFIKKEHSGNCVISVDMAKQFIDQILEFDKTDFFKQYIENSSRGKIILEFVGGDALQYPELLDEMITYFVKQLINKNHKWLYSWLIGISTNGVSLLNPKSRQFCEKWKNNISMGISIDGCPELHDLNRWCFADNEDGSHRGSWQYIKEIWPWYKKIFQTDALQTKWTLAPNSYKYMYESIKFLHEKLGMQYLLFNRVMEDEIIDTPEQLWELIQQFEKSINYIAEHHVDLYCDPFKYANTSNLSKRQQFEIDPAWSRCGFGKMPTLSLDGNVYPCFRLVPKNNNLLNSNNYAQGTYKSLLENENMLVRLNENSIISKMKNEEKCETCKIFVACPHCAADCVNKHDGTLAKTTSVCNFTRLQVYYARKYWEKIKSLYPSLYQKNKIIWTQEDQDELFQLVLKEIINLKEKEGEKNDICQF
jgi:uncharacterized protein